MTYFSSLSNHLWQSTIFAAGVLALAFLLRNNRPRVRYALWHTASIKFLIPFALFVGIGERIMWRSTPVWTPAAASTMEQVSQPFTPKLTWAMVAKPPAPRPALAVPIALAIWVSGSAIILGCWTVRWFRIRKAVKESTALEIDARIPVRASRTRLEPGVFGILRPVLLLPEGLADRVSPAQFQAILAHELCHVRRRDNLTAALHMLVQATFWFHPRSEERRVGK